MLSGLQLNLLMTHRKSPVSNVNSVDWNTMETNIKIQTMNTYDPETTPQPQPKTEFFKIPSEQHKVAVTVPPTCLCDIKETFKCQTTLVPVKSTPHQQDINYKKGQEIWS